MTDISIFILTMKRYELKILVEEILKEVRLSRHGPIRLTRIQTKDKTCSNCGETADYNMNGSWVCQMCYPYNKWDTSKSKEIRQKRNRKWMLKQIRGITGLVKQDESTEPSIGGSYSDQGTNVNGYDVTQLERDPLNDPRLTGKKPFKESVDGRVVHDGGYTFRIFSELAKGDGFDYPVDVKRGTIYLGTLRVMNNGYVVRTIDTPDGIVSYTDLPPYKTALTAAQVLHVLWATYRKNI